jgi:indolepyruvate ferredoxin oxidoreductase
VARLHLKTDVAAMLAEEFPGGAKVHYKLHPPMLRAMGLKRKLTLGTWFDPAFRALHAMRGLRGTVLDPFGRAEVRRVERALIGEYRALLERAITGLAKETYDRAVTVAELPDVIRGYEEIKLHNVARFREQARALGL